MGCRIEFSEEQIAKIEEEERAEQQRRAEAAKTSVSPEAEAEAAQEAEEDEDEDVQEVGKRRRRWKRLLGSDAEDEDHEPPGKTGGG